MNQLPLGNSSYKLIRTTGWTKLIGAFTNLLPLVDDMPDERWTDAKRFSEIIRDYLNDFQSIESDLSDAGLIDLGILYHHATEYYRIVEKRSSEALDYARRELRVHTKITSENKISLVASSLNTTGCIHQTCKQYQTALDYFERSLAMYKCAINGIDAKMITVIHNMGIAKHGLKQYTDAQELLTQSLNKRRTIFGGNDHPDVAQSLMDLGNLLIDQNKFDEALYHFNQSREMRERLLQGDHPFKAKSYKSIAMAYEKQNKYELSLQWHNMALNMLKRIYSNKNHSDIVQCYLDIGKLHEIHLNSLTDAHNCYLQALTMQRQLWENEMIDALELANCLLYVGYSYEKLKQYENALEYFNEIDEIYENSLPENHPNVQENIENMNRVAQLLNN